MPQILFVCSANRYRSVIAVACFNDELIRRKLESKWSVSSAGTWTRDGLPPMKEAVLQADLLGLDIHEHRSRAITGELLQTADLVLVMESGQKEALQIEFSRNRKKIMLLSEAAEGRAYDISDPIADPSTVGTASQICGLIRLGFDNICDLARR